MSKIDELKTLYFLKPEVPHRVGGKLYRLHLIAINTRKPPEVGDVTGQRQSQIKPWKGVSNANQTSKME